ncbi:MAG TPA: GNAT family N-acetyltransferase [Candidatus Dormibacteraeota bacterium]|jgi:GNAT superfamily N-acetyltransferase
MGDGAQPIQVREIDLAATQDLRLRVLRSHLPGLAAHAPADHLAATWHLGAFRGGRLVGVVTGFSDDAPGHPGVPAQRFRFMAVEPSEQGGGVGTALLAEVIDRARSGGNRLLWANGRDTALEFYIRIGFHVVGESFSDLVSQLPHHVVLLEL